MSDNDDGGSAFNDLAAVVLLTGVMMTVVLVPDELPYASVVRLLVGVPFLLFVPGYPLTLALYPLSRPERAAETGASAESFDRRALTPIERIVLSMVTSLAVVAVVAVVATVTPWGINELPLAFGVAGVTVLAVAVAARTRRRVPAASGPAGVGSEVAAVATSAIRDESRALTLLNVAVLVSVILAMSTVAIQPFGSPESDEFSEYQLLVEGPDGDLVAADYPDEFTAGEGESIFVRIQNHEGQPVNYTVVAQLQRVNGTDESFQTIRTVELDRYHVPVDADGSQTIEHSASVTRTGDFRLVYLFYKADAPADPEPKTADDALHLWINISNS